MTVVLALDWSPVRAFAPLPPTFRRFKRGAELWAAYQVGELALGPSAVNLRRVSAKDAVSKARSRGLEVAAGRHVDAISAQLRAELRAVSHAVNTSAPETVIANVQTALEDTAPGWSRVMAKLYAQVISGAARRTWADFQRAAIHRTAPFTPVLFRITKDDDPWEKLVSQFLGSKGGKQIKGITDTMRRQVTDALSEGIQRGEDISQLKARVEGLHLPKIIPHRAEVIARTESHMAASYGHRGAAAETGLPLDHEWWTALDDRVRGTKPKDRFSHVLAHGQVVDFNQPYVVSNEQLLHPGDGSYGASAGNIIQCRCVELFHTKAGFNPLTYTPPSTGAGGTDLPPDSASEVTPRKPRAPRVPRVPKVPKAPKLPPPSSVRPGAFQEAFTDLVPQGEQWGKTGMEISGRLRDLLFRTTGHDVVVSLGDMHPELARRAANTFAQLSIRFPRVFASRLQSIRVGSTSTPKALAGYIQGGETNRIVFNTSRALGFWSDLSTTNTILRQAQSKGWLAAEGVEGVASHEFGHAVDWLLGKYQKPGPSSAGRYLNPKPILRPATQVRSPSDGPEWAEWFKVVEDRKVLGKQLSQYALTNHQEAWAEAFSQIVTLSPDRWSPAAKALNKILEKEHRRLL